MFGKSTLASHPRDYRFHFTHFICNIESIILIFTKISIKYLCMPMGGYEKFSPIPYPHIYTSFSRFTHMREKNIFGLYLHIRRLWT